jgi:glyoxylase-like metal-dependent hydrolase (beta-lactamase superfamily II)
MPQERWTVGDYTITSVLEEQTERVPPALFYPAQTEQDIQRHPWLVPDFADARGRLKFRVQAFVIEGCGRRLLVDPCVGNDKRRENQLWNMRSYPFLERLAEAGLSVDAIDTVVHTHLHSDHLGWDTRRVGDAWQPTFARARYLYTQRELDALKAEKNERQDPYADSVAPIIEAGLADVVDEDAQLADGIRLESTTGHTPGHVCLWVESRGDVALISGDVVHNPVQCAEPHWVQSFDADPEAARATRERLLASVSERGALLLGTHFPNRPAGRVVRDGKAYRFVPL